MSDQFGSEVVDIAQLANGDFQIFHNGVGNKVYVVRMGPDGAVKAAPEYSFPVNGREAERVLRFHLYEEPRLSD